METEKPIFSYNNNILMDNFNTYQHAAHYDQTKGPNLELENSEFFTAKNFKNIDGLNSEFFTEKKVLLLCPKKLFFGILAGAKNIIELKNENSDLFSTFQNLTERNPKEFLTLILKKYLKGKIAQRSKFIIKLRMIFSKLKISTS